MDLNRRLFAARLLLLLLLRQPLTLLFLSPFSFPPLSDSLHELGLNRPVPLRFL